MKFKPLRDKILIKRVNEDEKTKGGIIIPDTAKEKPMQGTVVSVGNGKMADNGSIIPMTVKQDDRVLFGKYSGTEIKFDGEDHLILREDDILGIVK